MKIKIAILGSTGSIGKTTINIINKNINDFQTKLLTTNNNAQEIYKQAVKLNVKNVIIVNKNNYLKIKNKFNKKKIKVFHNLKDINKILKKKIDYTMCSISGLSGLKSTLDAIKLSKTVGIANKESIICAWNLLKISIKKNKTNFIPIDSEHFSIWSLIKKEEINTIDEIIITASGGPFLKKNINQINNSTPKDAVKHPNWSMGKKISIDSATLMNKVFEVIEAKKIFNIKIKKFSVLIHPKSYVHAIIKFNNGLIKFLAHDTDMTIPIFNSIYFQKKKKLNGNKINLKILNYLKLSKPDKKKFPALKILNLVPEKDSLFETILVSANDELVDYFLKGKIKFNNIYKNLFKIINLKEFKKYFQKKPNDIHQIQKLIEEVRLKTRELCIK